VRGTEREEENAASPEIRERTSQIHCCPTDGASNTDCIMRTRALCCWRSAFCTEVCSRTDTIPRACAVACAASKIPLPPLPSSSLRHRASLTCQLIDWLMAASRAANFVSSCRRLVAHGGGYFRWRSATPFHSNISSSSSSSFSSLAKGDRSLHGPSAGDQGSPRGSGASPRPRPRPLSTD
jgi:hypothetical protein